MLTQQYRVTSARDNAAEASFVLDVDGDVVAGNLPDATIDSGRSPREERLGLLVYRANLVVAALETVQTLATTLSDRNDLMPKYLDRIADEGKAFLRRIEETTGFRPWNAPSRAGQPSGTAFRTVPEGAIPRAHAIPALAALGSVDAETVNRVLGERYADDPAGAVKAQSVVEEVLAQLGLRMELPVPTPDAGQQRHHAAASDDDSPSP